VLRASIAIGIVVALAVIGAGLLLHRAGSPAPDGAPPSPQAQTGAPHPQIGLDLLRIEPVGSFVAAGHAQPGSAVQIRQPDGTILADGLVDGRGEWLVASRNSLSAGSHELLVFSGTDGGKPDHADVVAIVNVPAVRGPRPLAIAMTPGEAPRVLQSPDGPGASAGLIESAEFSEKGVLTLGGRADPGTLVYIYIDDAFLGEAAADSIGRWIRPGGGDRVAPGLHRVRIDVLAPSGDVASRGMVRFGPSAAGPGGIAVEEEPKLWRVRRPVGAAQTREVIIFRPGAVERSDPRAVLPGQMISPQSMPLQPTPLQPEGTTGDR